jgi:hypothetical protein
MALWCHAQDNGKFFGALLVIIRVALMTTQVSIAQRIGHHSHVRLSFVHRPIIPAMTVPAEIIAGVDDMPLALIRDRIDLGVAGKTRRWWWI